MALWSNTEIIYYTHCHPWILWEQFCTECKDLRGTQSYNWRRSNEVLAVSCLLRFLSTLWLKGAFSLGYHDSSIIWVKFHNSWQNITKNPCNYINKLFPLTIITVKISERPLLSCLLKQASTSPKTESSDAPSIKTKVSVHWGFRWPFIPVKQCVSRFVSAMYVARSNQPPMMVWTGPLLQGHVLSARKCSFTKHLLRGEKKSEKSAILSKINQSTDILKMRVQHRPLLLLNVTADLHWCWHLRDLWYALTWIEVFQSVSPVDSWLRVRWLGMYGDVHK